jgi:tetratricopeptide (TPR) repeat protein
MPRNMKIVERVLPFALLICFLATGWAQSSQHDSSFDEAFGLGQELVKQGRLAEAEVAIEKARSLSPEDTQVLTLLGKVKGRLGECQAAIALFQRVVELKPKSADAHLNLAIVFSDAGEFPHALVETEKALAIDPNLAAAHFNRARILDDLKREPEAGAEFSKACRLTPNDADCFFYWSFVVHAEGDFAKETILLQRVVKLQPERSKAFVLLGSSLLEQSRTAEAVVALRRALEIDPNSSEAAYMLSRALKNSDPSESRRLKEHFDALRQKNAAVERSKTLGNEAYGASTQQDWAKATSLYREALETCGDCEIQAALRKNLGLVLCRAGNLQDGGNELRKALELNPNDPDVVKALSVLGQN